MSPAHEDPRFRLIAPLGRGGTADVVRVWVNDLGREAALKYALPDQSTSLDEFLKLAKREYELIGTLSFPGLVRLLEPPTAQPGYLLLELCQGPTLDQVGRAENLDQALRLLSAIAVGLEYLRATELVHGDLKPQNIFLPREWRSLSPDSLFYAKLSDFSLGRRASESEERRAGLGTVGYMAPEVIAQKTTSHQSDLFAFGVIAYQFVTGVHPFLNEDCEPVRVNSRIQEASAPPVDQLRPDLANPALAQLIDQLLAKNAADRPKTAFEVCEALERAGSTFPFRKAIRPRHLIRYREDYETNRDRLFAGPVNERRQLDDSTGMSLDALSLLASANFSRGNLAYESGRFHFAGGVWWPSLLRRRVLNGFASESLARRRRLIRSAITEETSALQGQDRQITSLLPYLLRPQTIRRLSASAALSAERNSACEQAAKLYVQSGDLAGAERCAYQAATTLARDSHWRPALRLLDSVIEFAGLGDRRHEAAQLLLLKGNVLKDSGDTLAAESAYRELIALLEARPVDKMLGVVYNKLGDLYKMRSDFESGLAALQKALAIFEQLGDELEYSHTCNNLGNTYWTIAALDKSLTYYRRALRLQRKHAATGAVATTLSNLGSILCVTGKFKRGTFLLNASLKLKRELGHAGEIARTLNNLGYVHYVLGEHGKALSFLEESMELNRRIGSRKEIMINLENLTTIMISAGRFRQSVKLTHEGLELSQELGDLTQEIVFSVRMSTVLMHLGKLGDAEKLLSTVGLRLSETDDLMAVAVHALTRAQLLIQIGNRQEATVLVHRALEIARESKDTNGQLQAFLLLARLEDPPECRAQADQIISHMHFERMRSVMAYNHSERLLHNGDHVAALAAITAFLAAPFETEEDADGARQCLIAAECFMTNQRSDEALPYVQHAQRQAADSGLMSESMMCGILMGRLAVERRDFECAFREFQRALKFAQTMSQSFTRDCDRNMFQQRRDVKYLTEEIKRLGLTLGQTERAGSTPARA